MNELNNFIKIREDFSKELEPAAINSEKKCWEFFINSNTETQQAYEQAEDKFYSLYKDEKIYNKLKEIDKNKYKIVRSNECSCSNYLTFYQQIDFEEK